MSTAEINTLKSTIAIWQKVERLYDYVYKLQEEEATWPVLEVLVPGDDGVSRIGVDLATMDEAAREIMVEALLSHAAAEYRRAVMNIQEAATEAVKVLE